MEKKTVLEKFSNILNDFSQTKSDAVSIEASQFENLEKDYSKFLKEELGEGFIISLINQMCEESLHPELFAKWELVRYGLSTNRVKLTKINKPSYNVLLEILDKCNGLIKDFQTEVSIDNDDVLPYSKVVVKEIDELISELKGFKKDNYEK